jgi:hypothetical protein
MYGKRLFFEDLQVRDVVYATKASIWSVMQFRIDLLCYGPQSNVVWDTLIMPFCNIYQRMKWNDWFCDDHNVSYNDCDYMMYFKP